ncbi:MAG: hypothetical protein J6D54_13815 [Olsenella sp.]|nr:hypothetical protein [Olsenella sp.]
MAYSIKETRGKISDIKGRLEDKRAETEKLEENRQALLDAGTDVQGSDIDEDAQQTIMDLINQALEDNSDKAQEVSDEIGQDLSELEGMQQDTQQSLESNQQERGKVEQKKSLLDRVGLGGSLDGALGEFDDNRADLEDVRQELTDTSQEADELVRRLGVI